MNMESDLGESNYESNRACIPMQGRQTTKIKMRFQERTLNNSEERKVDVKVKGVREKGVQKTGSFLQRNKAH